MTLRDDPKFRRLKVGGSGPFGSAEYWLGPDHLLVVSTSFYTESYRRFFFVDIQAIICQKTRMAALFSVLSIIFLILSFAIGAAVRSQGSDALAGLIICAVFAVISATLLIVNAIRGDTCVAQITTAVQTTALPCVTRWRKAQKLVRELEPLVRSAQSGSTVLQPPVSPEGAHTANG